MVREGEGMALGRRARESFQVGFIKGPRGMQNKRACHRGRMPDILHTSYNMQHA